MDDTPVIEFWFDFASTYSYLSAMRIAPLAQQHGVRAIWKPFLLGPVFKAQGWDTSPFNIYPAKGRYMWRDVERQARRYGLPFVRPGVFPQFALTATRICVAASSQPWHDDFCRALFSIEYGKGGDISGDEAVSTALCSLGETPSGWLERARDAGIRQALRDRVAEAQDKGIFGAPTFVAPDGELFWGDDRLEMALSWSTG